MAGVKEGAGEANVAEHVRFERELRGWSTGELAKRVTEAGCPMSQSAVWRIESGEPRRKISVDEMIAFAKVFGKAIDDLLQPPTTEYPEDLVREYVLSWLRAELTVWHKKLNARVAFGDVVNVLHVYPGAVPKLPEVIADLSEQEHLLVVKRQVEEVLRELPGMLKAVDSNDVIHMSKTRPLIDYWTRLGMSTEEMVAEASRHKLEGSMRGTFRSDIEMGDALTFIAEEATASSLRSKAENKRRESDKPRLKLSPEENRRMVNRLLGD